MDVINFNICSSQPSANQQRSENKDGLNILENNVQKCVEPASEIIKFYITDPIQ